MRDRRQETEAVDKDTVIKGKWRVKSWGKMHKEWEKERRGKKAEKKNRSNNQNNVKKAPASSSVCRLVGNIEVLHNKLLSYPHQQSGVMKNAAV